MNKIKPKHRRSFFVICSIMLGVLVLIFVSRCRKEQNVLLEAKDSREGRELIQALNSAPSVKINNGEAAVIKVPEGYIFFVPKKFKLEAGKYTAYFSDSEDFSKNAKFVKEEYWGPDDDCKTKIFGHTLWFMGGDQNSTIVELSPFEPPNTTAIAKYNGVDPNKMDVSKLNFVQNPGLAREATVNFLEKAKNISQ